MPERLIDVPLESLPFIDEHSAAVCAPAERTWEALVATVRGSGAARLSRAFARGLDCLPLETSGEIPRIGATIPGFVVTRSVRPAALALMGEHRFSRYALVFTITERVEEGSVDLTAQTRAVFPGRKGRAYRTLVIGTRAHVAVTKTILRSVRRRAERA